MKLWESEYALVSAATAEDAARTYTENTDEPSLATDWEAWPMNKRITLYDEETSRSLKFWPKSLVAGGQSVVGTKDI